MLNSVQEQKLSSTHALPWNSTDPNCVKRLFRALTCAIQLLGISDNMASCVMSMSKIQFPPRRVAYVTTSDPVDFGTLLASPSCAFQSTLMYTNSPSSQSCPVVCNDICCLSSIFPPLGNA